MITKDTTEIEAKKRMKKTIGANLRKFRKAYPASMEEIARLLQVSYSTYWHWEAGDESRHMISIFDLLRISKIYKVKIIKLLEGID